jgi:hypothetical protein
MENKMDATSSPRASAKDFFINLGAMVALYTLVGSLVTLLFTVINKAYHKTVNMYDYYSSTSISWPVATLIIFFPIFILLMWILERDFKVNPEKQNIGIHKWLTYITLFISGLVIAGDLITVLYYFLDGQDITTGFILKVISLLILAGGIFSYYIMDVMGKLNSTNRKIYRVIAFVIILGSIVWGFQVLGSPMTQRMYKYDTQRVSDLESIDSLITNYYAITRKLPATMDESLKALNTSYSTIPTDPETKEAYVYTKTRTLTYDLCATFKKASPEQGKPNIYARPLGYQSWQHGAGYFCFNQTINPKNYPLYEDSVPVKIR